MEVDSELEIYNPTTLDAPLKIEEEPLSNEVSPAYDYANSKISFGQTQQQATHRRFISQASENISGGEIVL